MKSYKVNQHTDRFGLKQSTIISVWQVAALTLFGVIVAIKLEPPVISPLPDNPIVETVRAVEYTPKTDIFDAAYRIAGKHAPKLLKIAKCESSYKENAISKTGDFGYLQIHLATHKSRVPGRTLEEKKRWLLNGENNLTLAYTLFLEQGTKPWRYSRACHGL